MLNYLKWAGTALTIGGALATALHQDPLNIVLFNLGAVIWLAASIQMRDRALIAVNAGLLIIYVFGAVLRL
jgi:energy-converting hydrogenase Eha subunit C